MTQDRARLVKAVPCIYAIISSTIEEGQSQTGGRKFIQQLFLLLLLLTGKRNFTAVSNFPLAKCYKYSPSSPFTELVCDSFLPFRLLVSNCGYQYSSKAFLFSLVNVPGLAPVKLFQKLKNTVVQAMDQHLVTETIFTLLATPHPTQNLTRTLESPTVHHPAALIAVTTNHS